MQHEVLAVLALERVDDLLVLAGTERGHDQRLRLAAGEQRRAVGARQDADLGHDRTDRLGVAAVDALAGVEDGGAHDVGFEVAELLAEGGQRLVVALEQFLGLGLHRADLGLAGELLRLAIGFGHLAAHLGLELGGHGLGRFRRLGERQRILGAMLGELDDGVDHRLEGAMALHDGRQHDVLGQLLGLGLDHQHAFLGAGDDEVEGALLGLFEGRIDHELAVEVADAGAGDRTHEGHAADRESGRRGDHRQDVGIVLEVVRERGDDHQGLVAIALVEQRTDRTIDQARGQDLLLGGPSFTLEEAARDLAGGERLLLVVHGEREEIEAGLGLLLEHDGRQHGGAAVGRQDRAVGLARDLAGLEHELAPGPLHFLAEHLKHITHIHLPFLHGVRPRLATAAHRRPCAGRTGSGLCSRPCLPGYCEVASAGRILREPDDATRKGPAERRGREINA